MSGRDKRPHQLALPQLLALCRAEIDGVVAPGAADQFADGSASAGYGLVYWLGIYDNGKRTVGEILDLVAETAQDRLWRRPGSGHALEQRRPWHDDIVARREYDAARAELREQRVRLGQLKKAEAAEHKRNAKAARKKRSDDVRARNPDPA